MGTRARPSTKTLMAATTTRGSLEGGPAAGQVAGAETLARLQHPSAGAWSGQGAGEGAGEEGQGRGAIKAWHRRRR